MLLKNRYPKLPVTFDEFDSHAAVLHVYRIRPGKGFQQKMLENYDRKPSAVSLTLWQQAQFFRSFLMDRAHQYRGVYSSKSPNAFAELGDLFR